MGNLIFKPASGGVLKLQDAGSTDRITVTDGGTTVLNEDGGAAALTVETNGNITVETGSLVIGTDSATTGITFGGDPDTRQNSPTPGDRTLYDYEEGHFTGTVTDGTHHMTMVSYTGFYTKIGNLVTITGFFSTSSLDVPPADPASGSIFISGLPFTVYNHLGALAGGAAGYGGGLDITSGENVTFDVDADTTNLILRVWDLATGTSTMTAAEWTADGALKLGITYRAA